MNRPPLYICFTVSWNARLVFHDFWSMKTVHSSRTTNKAKIKEPRGWADSPNFIFIRSTPFLSAERQHYGDWGVTYINILKRLWSTKTVETRYINRIVLRYYIIASEIRKNRSAVTTLSFDLRWFLSPRQYTTAMTTTTMKNVYNNTRTVCNGYPTNGLVIVAGLQVFHLESRLPFFKIFFLFLNFIFSLLNFAV